MKITNAWKSQNKQVDRVEIRARLGSITLFELVADLSNREWRVGLGNFFLSN